MAIDGGQNSSASLHSLADYAGHPFEAASTEISYSSAPHQLFVSVDGDDRNDGGAEAPLRTITAALAKAPPGTAIMVKAGVYTENVKIGAGGTPEAPLWLVSADGPGAAKLVPQHASVDTVRLNGSDNVVIQGFEIEGPSLANAVHLTRVGTGDLPTNIVILDNIIEGGGGDGVKVSWGDHVHLLNNTIRGSASEQGIDFVGVRHGVIAHNDVSGIAREAAIQVKGGSFDVVIEGNRVHDTGADGIRVGGVTDSAHLRPDAGGFEAADIVVRDNEVGQTGHHGIRIFQADGVDVIQNWIHEPGGVAVDLAKVGLPSQGIAISDNFVDAANWLRADAGQLTAVRVGANQVDSEPPADWTSSAGAPTVDQTPADTAPHEAAPEPPADPDPPAAPPDDLAIDRLIEAGSYAAAKFGSGRSDRLFGGDGKDLISGEDGDDLLFGAHGNDALVGGAGEDRLYGGAGSDALVGGWGDDILFGGPGADAFLFASDSGHDRIEDFEHGDLIVLVSNLNGSGITSVADLADRITDGPGGVLIDLGGGNSIALQGVSAAALSAADFMFI